MRGTYIPLDTTDPPGEPVLHCAFELPTIGVGSVVRSVSVVQDPGLPTTVCSDCKELEGGTPLFLGLSGQARECARPSHARLGECASFLLIGGQKITHQTTPHPIHPRCTGIRNHYLYPETPPLIAHSCLQRQQAFYHSQRYVCYGDSLCGSYGCG